MISRLRSSRTYSPLALLLLLACLAAPATAQDEEGGEEETSSEFETNWIGLRVGSWFRPSINMDVQVTGRSTSLAAVTNVIGSEFDIERDLGVSSQPRSEHLVDFDAEAVLEIEPFIETDFISVYGFLVTPFEYRGTRTLTREIRFGGATFAASSTTKSTFNQFFMGTDVTINIFNNRYFRVSPLVGLRAIGIDWEIESSGPLSTLIKGDTSDIKAPFKVGRYQILPYPEVGVQLHAGYRDYVDVALRVAGSYIGYYNIEGGTLRVELTATVYPIPWIGIQVGGRYLDYDLRSQASSRKRGSFDFDLNFVGATIGLIVRI